MTSLSRRALIRATAAAGALVGAWPVAAPALRAHSGAPAIHSWRLRVSGSGLATPRAKGDALSLSYADLRRLPVTRVTATHECTGNGRSFFASQQGTPATAPRGRLARSARSPGRASVSPKSAGRTQPLVTPYNSNATSSTPW